MEEAAFPALSFLSSHQQVMKQTGVCNTDVLQIEGLGFDSHVELVSAFSLCLNGLSFGNTKTVRAGG